MRCSLVQCGYYRQNLDYPILILISYPTCTSPMKNYSITPYCLHGGAWWLIGRFVAFRPKGRWFESHSSRHVGTLCKSLVCSCFRHSIRAVSGAPLSSSGHEEVLYK